MEALCEADGFGRFGNLSLMYAHATTHLPPSFSMIPWYLSFSSGVRPVRQMTGNANDASDVRLDGRRPSPLFGGAAKSLKLRFRLRLSNESIAMMLLEQLCWLFRKDLQEYGRDVKSTRCGFVIARTFTTRAPFSVALVQNPEFGDMVEQVRLAFEIST